MAQVTLKGIDLIVPQDQVQTFYPAQLGISEGSVFALYRDRGEQSGWVMAGTSSVRPTKDRLLRKWSNSGMLICVIFSKINPAI